MLEYSSILSVHFYNIQLSWHSGRVQDVAKDLITPEQSGLGVVEVEQ